MKKKNVILVSLFLILVMVASGCSSNNTPQTNTPQQSAPQQLSIGTASIGGAFYPVGQEISNLVTKHAEGIEMIPEVTAGAIENPRLINNKDVELGITNANLAYFAYKGEGAYEQKMDISAISSLHPSVFHIIAKENSSINSIADLKGKKIAVGPAGGGTLPILEAILEAYGLNIKDITPSYLSYADGFSQLSDDNVDVALALAGYPTSAVMEISATKKIKFINIDKDKMSNIIEKYPYYSEINVPKDVYKLDADAMAVGVLNTLIVSNDLDEETVYKITKAIFDNLDEFKAANATAKQIDLQTASQASIPLHPGAKKYFDEKK